MIAVIGGSGLYDIEGFKVIDRRSLETPFGKPSGEFVIGQMKNVEAVFLPRHGKGHILSPSEINYRANIYGLKALGVKKIISISAVGSLKEEYKPCDILLPDQFIDRTRCERKNTFFENGIVAHLGFGEPICPVLRKNIFDLLKTSGDSDLHNGGTYINIEGPTFSTKAESLLYKSWGADVIGMTNMVEARLAREAEMCYATVAMITDYDAWHPDHDHVTVAMIMEYFAKNVSRAKAFIKNALPQLQKNNDSCSCHSALAGAIITAQDCISDCAKKDLDVIIGKYLS